MLEPTKTHREIAEPEIAIGQLADYMAAMSRNQHRAARRIVEGCKYRPIGRIVQHREARMTLSSFICSPTVSAAWLLATAESIRQRLASDEFDRQVWDANADYICRFVEIWSKIQFPEGTISQPGPRLMLEVGDCKLTAGLQFRLRRVMKKTNQIRIGGGMLRYAKGKALPALVGVWQSAVLLGMLAKTNTDEDAAPEGKLCVTFDAYTGNRYLAPTNSVTRFKEAEAACGSIAKMWPNIPPPPNAVI